MTTRDIARYVVLVGIFVLPLSVFLVTPSMFFPFITGKNFFFRALVEIIFAAWVILAIWDPHYRPRRSLIFICSSVFLAVIAIADFFGENFLQSFWSNFERMEGLITLIHLVAYAFVVGTVLRTEKIWAALYNMSVVVSMFVGFKAIDQLTDGVGRVDATLGNATYLAIYMVFHFFLTLWLMYRARASKVLVGVYSVVLVLQATVVYFTATRGAILGLVGGLLITALYITIFGREYPGLRKLALGGLFAVLFLIGGFFAIKDTSLVQRSLPLQRIASISLEDGTTQSRFLIWSHIAWNGFKERPVLGWGQENFIYVFGKYYHPEMYKQEPWFDRAHNVFFDWLIAGGILGLLSYLSLFVAALYYLWRPQSSFSVVERGIFTGLLAAYFFHNIFVFDNIISYLLFFTILGFVHSRGVDGKTEHDEGQQLSSAVKWTSTGVVVVLLLIALYGVVGRGVATAQSLIHAIRQQPGGIEENLSYYKQTLGYGYLGRQEVRVQITRNGAQIQSVPEVPQKVRDEFLELAIAQSEASVVEDPTNPRVTHFHAVFLTWIGRIDEAKVWFEKARALSPRRQLVLAELGNIALVEERYDDGFAIFKETYELAPDFQDVALRYAVAAIYAGEHDVAKGVLEKAFGTQSVDHQLLIQAYARTGQYDKALEIWKSRAAQSPDDLQTQVALSAAYFEVGDQAAAIATLEAAITRFSDFEAQGHQMLESLKRGERPQ